MSTADTVAATIPELAESPARARYAASLWDRNVQWLVDRGHPADRVIETELLDRGIVARNSPEHVYLLAYARAHYARAATFAAERRAALDALDEEFGS